MQCQFLPDQVPPGDAVRWHQVPTEHTFSAALFLNHRVRVLVGGAGTALKDRRAPGNRSSDKSRGSTNSHGKPNPAREIRSVGLFILTGAIRQYSNIVLCLTR